MKAPDIKTALPGPKARAIIDRDAKFVSPSYTRDYPLVIARGEGAVVEDVDGNVFVDCAAGIAVNSTGVSHPEVVKAIADQAAKFIHMSGTDFYYEPQVRLAEELSKLDQILVHLSAPDEVSAIVVEPIQGEGGYLVSPPAFLQGLRELTKQHGIMLVFDEVQSGMGRTGKWFAADHYGVKADIVNIAKGIASGLPLGITCARADVMDWPPGAHASTFGGNPVSCAAALVTIKLLREQYVQNAAAVGDYMMAGLRELQNKHAIIGDVRGKGLMIGV